VDPAVAAIRASIERRAAEVDVAPDLLARLLRSLADRVPRHLDRLADALARGDAAGLADEAHVLVGVAGNLGVEALAGPGRELELLGRAGTLAAAPDVLARLRRRSRPLATAIDQVLAGLPGAG
jgi:HPt (histidine-containing phosphotransfer) domain-containing protein